MAELTTLDALQALHRDLVALNKGFGEGIIENEALLQIFEQELELFWTRPQKNEQSRNALKTGRKQQIVAIAHIGDNLILIS